MILRYHVFAPMLVVFSLAAGTRGQAEATVEVTLSSEKAEYLRGEPVHLLVDVENVGHDVVQFSRVYVGPDGSEISLSISADGESFRNSDWGASWLEINQANQWFHEYLEPAASKRYDLYVLYERATHSRMAFEKAGPYWLKVFFPLNARQSDGSHTLKRVESNVVQVEINEPEGSDAEVFEMLRKTEFLYFLQSGEVEAGQEKVPLKMAEILETVSKSSYHPAVRYALARYYQTRRLRLTYEKARDDPELTRIRSVIGVREVPPGPFLDDRRLDKSITFHFAKPMPIQDCVEQFSHLSGVRLQVDAALQGAEGFRGLQLTRSLRTLMDFMAKSADAVWIRDGAGYRLVPQVQEESRKEGKERERGSQERTRKERVRPTLGISDAF